MSKLNIQIFLKEIESIKTNNIYSNILLTFQNNLSVLDKLKLFYYQSQYYLNSKDFNNLTRIAIESIKIYMNEKEILIDENNKYFIYLFNIFYHTFELYKNDEKKIIISYYFILLSKKMLFEIDNEGKNTPLKKINNEAKEIENKLRSELNKIKNEKFDILENNGEKFLENEKKKLFKVVHNLLNSNIFFIQNESDLNEGEVYYLISKSWLKKYYSFIELLNSIENNCEDYNNFLATAFDVDKQINNFHENENNFSYVYKINNFWIENYKNILFDPDENFSYTNIFIEKEKNKNFVLIKENDWNLLSNNFDFLNEIKRFKTNGKLETNLFQLKILLINKEIKKINCDLISEKNIQLSKFSIFKDFKEKIKRILIKILNKKDLNENLINFYKNTQNEEIQIAKILLSFENNINKIKIFCEDLKIVPNETKITNIFKENDLIIIEIKNNLNQQNFIIPNDLTICNNCSKNLENFPNKKQCDFEEDCLCFYCSNKCLENDKNHKNFHEILSKFFKKKINLTELKSFSLNSILNRNSKNGLIGLNNLGNTCFMNSALQCLSNCEDLTKFFLSKNYLEEINKNNSLGTKGQLANAYYNLLKKLWLDSSENFSPNHFRAVFIRFVPQFSGFAQQDSNEFLTILIDKLHEDLNRVSKKPYFELKNKRSDETDKEASIRWWKLYKLREDSIIVDLFHGQFKSKIYCPECGKISINFDPFMFISLPIPTGRYNVNIRYVNNQNNFDFFNLILTENSTSNEFKEEIIKKTQQKIFRKDDYLNLIDLILVDKNKKIIKIFNENEFIFDYLYNLNNELIAFQKEENKINIYLYLTKYNIDYKFFIVPFENIFYLDFYPFKISLNINENLSKIYQKINNEIIKTFFNDENDETKSLLKEKNIIINENNESDLKYFLHFNSFMNYENDFCDFCGFKIYNYLDHHCKFIERFKKNEKINYILSKISQKNFPLILDIQLLSNNIKFIGRNYYKSSIKSNNFSSNEKNLDIYDCLNLFRSEERLQEDNMWYCSNCKKHQMAFKKIDIYKEPLYLIIQLKRFKQNNYSYSSSIFEGLYGGDGKNSTFIDFPIKNLDLSKFVIREDKPNKILYDLFAVTNHFGGASFGHYTADCKNNGSWFNFNDSSVMRIQDERTIVNSSAYILFYKKKNI